MLFVPDDTLFAEEALPDEEEDPWSCPRQLTKLEVGSIGALLNTTFVGIDTYRGDLDTAFSQLHRVSCIFYEPVFIIGA